MFIFRASDVTDIDRATSREWLLANGLGGYASSTLCGMPTRRYHGLLVAAERPLEDRRLLVSVLSESVLTDFRRFELGCNRYPDAVYPQGFEHLASVEVGGTVVTHVWRLETGELERRVAMARGRNVTAVVYTWHGSSRTVLELRPLTACRSYHHCQRAHHEFNGTLNIAHQRAWLAPYTGAPEVHFGWQRGRVEPLGVWYYNLRYQAEMERGLDYEEDLYCPGVWSIPLSPGEPVGLTLSMAPCLGAEAHAIVAAAAKHQEEVVSASPLGALGDRRVDALLVAADSFLATREGGQSTVVAGYHWFTDWGRDAMIALPGTTLAHGDTRTARRVVRGFASAMHAGIIPNRFPDRGERPDYNTVDATLWMFVAAKRVADRLDDPAAFTGELWPDLRQSIDWHLRGTSFSIKADPSDGLLAQGDGGHQLTWMDAKVGDYVVTPRTGKPVEIAALWYNALRIATELGQLVGDAQADEYRTLAAAVAASFARAFWLEDQGYYADVATPDGPDRSLRPNQVIALSLPYDVARPANAARAMNAVERELATPYGLRSLAPADSRYCPVYLGGPFERDCAYHQGTVWAWLMGPYLRAYLKLNGSSAPAKAHARDLLEPLLDHVTDACVGSISEIFDGAAPHRPRGAVSQAWSVAEVLDVLSDCEPGGDTT